MNCDRVARSVVEREKLLEQSRADRKRLLNNNKPHVDTRGKHVEAKVFHENFVCTCPKQCTSLVPIEQRKRLFLQFHSIGTFEGRCALLVSCVTEMQKKQIYSKKIRRYTRIYSIYGHDVCKFVLIRLIRTLQINETRLVVALNKQRDCDTYADGRGTNVGGYNKIPLWKRENVCKHIESFPKYVSHYTRNQTDSKFLNSELNLAKMYRLYHCKYEFENPVSKSTYKKIFYQDFNLRFKVPKKDTCLKCDIYIAKIKSSSGPERLLLEEWHKEHLEQADSLRKQMNEDLAISKINVEVETLPFDMEKIHQCRKTPTSIMYYKRQLNLYNLGIHVGSSGKGIFNIWLEFEASKGTQGVGSCLKKYIESIDGKRSGRRAKPRF